ncbi:MAG: Transcriptional regulator CtsR [Firmicutes bacterium ADurb.Bin506]|jgi:transcriptional regulator CtsR|nr:MAG: Transcriptional regulator CtsR [Firmicutes bacterium ADurb.Bin506]
MASLADFIEGHIKLLFDTVDSACSEPAHCGPIELQRRELAERFRCAPSQITYVLATRFTPARGYLVESRRGGGGHIRIWRLRADLDLDLLEAVEARLGAGVDPTTARELVARLVDSGLIRRHDAEAALAAVLDDDQLGGAVGELVRSRSLRAVIRFLLLQGRVDGRRS